MNENIELKKHKNIYEEDLKELSDAVSNLNKVNFIKRKKLI
jgi:hypothetical protein